MRWILSILLFCQCLVAAPKVVVFDYGGVVAKVDRRPMLEFLSNTLGVSYKKLRRDYASDKLYVALQQSDDYWEEYAKTALTPHWHSEYNHQRSSVVRPIDGMTELIEQIREQGIQVALLSNTKFNRARFIENMGGYDLFDPILLSCHLGVKKPDPKIFRLMLRNLGHKPEECLFIDNRASNIAAANEFGIDGIVFETLEDLKEELIKRGITFD